MSCSIQSLVVTLKCGTFSAYSKLSVWPELLKIHLDYASICLSGTGAFDVDAVFLHAPYKNRDGSHHRKNVTVHHFAPLSPYHSQLLVPISEAEEFLHYLDLPCVT